MIHESKANISKNVCSGERISINFRLFLGLDTQFLFFSVAKNVGGISKIKIA